VLVNGWLTVKQTQLITSQKLHLKDV